MSLSRVSCGTCLFLAKPRNALATCSRSCGSSRLLPTVRLCAGICGVTPSAARTSGLITLARSSGLGSGRPSSLRRKSSPLIGIPGNGSGIPPLRSALSIAFQNFNCSPVRPPVSSSSGCSPGSGAGGGAGCSCCGGGAASKRDVIGRVSGSSGCVMVSAYAASLNAN